jgi:hypothetical protein
MDHKKLLRMLQSKFKLCHASSNHITQEITRAKIDRKASTHTSSAKGSSMRRNLNKFAIDAIKSKPQILDVTTTFKNFK